MTDQKLADAAVCLLLDCAILAFSRHDLEATEQKILRAMNISEKHLDKMPSRTEKFIYVFKMISELKEIDKTKEGGLQWPTSY